MKDFGFPQNWRINLSTVFDLAKKIGVPEEEILKIERHILREYRIVPIGGRTLTIPSDRLKALQRRILDRLANFDLPPYVHGGVRKKSIITNAKAHLNKKWVACIDIRKFFPSVHISRIEKIFTELGFGAEVTKTLVHLVTYEFQLPQGAPTSPVLANLSLYRLDGQVANACRVRSFSYTRFFDDLTISGNHRPHRLCEITRSIIEREGFLMNKNPKKFRIQPSKGEQIVTGIKVNGPKLLIPSQTLQETEGMLNMLRQGTVPAEVYENPYKAYESVAGKISFLRTIDQRKANELRALFESINWNRFGIE